MTIIRSHIYFFLTAAFMILAFFTLDSIGSEKTKRDSTLLTNIIIYDGSGDLPFRGSIEFNGELIIEVYRDNKPSNG